MYKLNETFNLTTGAETLFVVETLAGTRIQIISWGISFDGVVPTETPVLVTLSRCATDGVGTSNPPEPLVPGIPAYPASVLVTITSEPSDEGTLDHDFVTPNGGLRLVQFMPDERPIIAESKGFMIKVGAQDANVTAACQVTFGLY